SSDISCGSSTEKIRRKPLLLNLLHEAGASGETFTLKEVMHYLGQYIMLKQLYDKQQQHIVYCRNDPLGKVFEVESFSVKVPSQLYEMLSRNLIALNFHDSAQTRTLVKETNCLPLREGHLKCLTGEPSEEETVCIGIDTAIVSDSTDDLWFLNEPVHDQANVEIKEGAIHPKIRDREGEKEEDKNTDPKEVIEVTIYEAGEGLPCSGHATDPEISDNSWKCTKCGEDNPSQKQYCLQCWALRGGWHLKCPELTRSTAGPSITIAENEPYEESLDSLSQPSTSGLWRSREDLDSVGKGAKTVKRQCEDSLQSRRQRLGPCLIRGVRPRTGNIIHRKLYKRKMPCPVCVQPIIMAIQTFIG
ncbi:protein Mdm4-like, partial [Callorhinchus milii]|uniref:protein Mdm4-like n=1 Tax=Callorhinchus milii TaxID=7868 RepID=UPI001C3F8011